MHWTMHKPEECKLGMTQAQQCSRSHTTASQLQSFKPLGPLSNKLPIQLSHLLKAAGLWHHCLHGFCAIAEARNTNQTFLALYFLFIPIMFQHLLLLVCNLLITIKRNTLTTSQHICLHKGLPPKALIQVPST